MSNQNEAAALVGKVVSNNRHGTIGKVTGARDGAITVAYVGTCVEDELSPASVTVVSDPTPEQEAWDGGFGVVSRYGFDVVPSLPATMHSEPPKSSV